MNKLILCEGVTDAILLSYYLEKVSGWNFCKGPKNLAIKQNNNNESVNWYRKGEEYLLICGVGGKDNFGHFFESRIKNPLIMSNAFDKIAIVTDRDDRTVEQIIDDITLSENGLFSNMQDRVWCDNAYLDAFGTEKSIELLLVVIPQEHQGHWKM